MESQPTLLSRFKLDAKTPKDTPEVPTGSEGEVTRQNPEPLPSLNQAALLFSESQRYGRFGNRLLMRNSI